MFVQRLKVGGAGQHLDDAGAKHHAEGGRDDAQHDDAPQIASRVFFFRDSSILFPPFLLLGFTISVTVCSYAVNRLRMFAQKILVILKECIPRCGVESLQFVENVE